MAHGFDCLYCLISIHAPARGATHFNPFSYSINPISIHAPARGATQELLQQSYIHSISIHAPARGATCTVLMGYGEIVFQSTLPRGERPLLSHLMCHLDMYFNPRSREGSDFKDLLASFEQDISIHAPARGATKFTRCITILKPDFNPRSREGSDNVLCFFLVKSIRFQSTLPRGERRFTQKCFNS